MDWSIAIGPLALPVQLLVLFAASALGERFPSPVAKWLPIGSAIVLAVSALGLCASGSLFAGMVFHTVFNSTLLIASYWARTVETGAALISTSGKATRTPARCRSVSSGRRSGSPLIGQ